MDYYEILEIPNTASTRQIRSHYYRLAKRYHPDKEPSYPDSEHFKHLSEAYSTLSNPKKRYLYDIQRELTDDTHFPDYKFSETDLETLYSYYERFVEITEVKFLRTLYRSLPSTAKQTILHNLKACIQSLREKCFQCSKYPKKHCESLYDIRNLKTIDVSELREPYVITLQRSFEDVYENRCKIILVKLPYATIHLYVTHSDYTLCFGYLRIQITTTVPPMFHVDGYDIYIERPINLYQHFFLRNYILQMSSEHILYDTQQMTISNKGLRDPHTHRRGFIKIHHEVILNVDYNILNSHKEILRKIFDFDVSKSR